MTLRRSFGSTVLFLLSSLFGRTGAHHLFIAFTLPSFLFFNRAMQHSCSSSSSDDFRSNLSLLKKKIKKKKRSSSSSDANAQQPRFKWVVRWKCKRCPQNHEGCIPIRSESRCICGHRLKQHAKIEDRKPPRCLDPRCKCRGFFFIFAEGAFTLRCSCKHKATDCRSANAQVPPPRLRMLCVPLALGVQLRPPVGGPRADHRARASKVDRRNDGGTQPTFFLRYWPRCRNRRGGPKRAFLNVEYSM